MPKIPAPVKARVAKQVKKLVSKSNQFELEREAEYQASARPTHAEAVEKMKTIIDFSKWGQAIVLSNLAEAKGMHVKDVVGFPEHLKAAGLPEKMEHWIIEQAHKLNRNAIDASLWRWNRPLTQKAPELSWEEAKAEIPKPMPASHLKEPTPKDESRPVEVPRHDKAPTRKGILGFATKRVVMWMAKGKFTDEQVTKVLKHFDILVSSSSISGWSKNALSGKDGPPASPTPDQIKQLNKIAGRK